MSTVAAIATPDAPGGISVIRISGNDAFEIIDRIFKAYNGIKVQDMDGYTCSYGVIYNNNEKIDDVITTVFREPKSYTGENVVEISCHGGRFITHKVLRTILENGADPAPPGEFTKRAFFNGKMSLNQAESVMNIISSAGEIQLRHAHAMRDGTAFKKLDSIKKSLVKILADLSAWADFPEEDVPEVEPETLLIEINALIEKFDDAKKNYDRGRIVRDGINTVIIGRPNAGKSTLMNYLSGFQRSIVTNIEGTTRDVVEESVRVGDFTLRLSDTAGIHFTDNPIEKIGVDMAFKIMSNADLVLVVFDNSREISDEDLKIISKIKLNNAIAIINKIDEKNVVDKNFIYNKFAYVAEISAKNECGMECIEKCLEEIFGNIENLECYFIANERQKNCLDIASKYVLEAKKALESGVMLDAVTVLLDSAAEKLMELTGEKISDEIINDVFSRFCVGK